MPGGVDIEYFLNFVPRIRPEDMKNLAEDLARAENLARTNKPKSNENLFKDVAASADAATTKVKKLGKAVANVSNKSSGKKGGMLSGKEIGEEIDSIKKDYVGLVQTIAYANERIKIYSKTQGLEAKSQAERNKVVSAAADFMTKYGETAVNALPKFKAINAELETMKSQLTAQAGQKAILPNMNPAAVAGRDARSAQSAADRLATLQMQMDRSERAAAKFEELGFTNKAQATRQGMIGTIVKSGIDTPEVNARLLSAVSAFNTAQKGLTSTAISATQKFSMAFDTYAQKIEGFTKAGFKPLAQSARSSLLQLAESAKAQGISFTPNQLDTLKKVGNEYREIGKQGERNLLTIAKWAVGWTAVYSVIRSAKMLVINTMKDIFDLEEQVFRAVAASRFERGGLGNLPRAKEVQQLREAYTSTIKGLMQSTSAAPKDMAAGLYQLASAGLTAQEALAALPNAVDLAVGSYSDMEQVTRILATSYNVFGRSLDKNLSTQQKMAFIADTLAGAYNRDQIEISELTKTLEYCSPSASRLNIEFDKLVTTIGFVSNFGMRGSRAGTDLNRFFLDASKNAAKLKKEFGIDLDPKQALDPIKLINKFHEADLKGRVTASGLNRIFGTKGGESLKLILGDWEKWNKLVTDSNIAVNGTAAGLRELAEEATTKKILKLKGAWEAFNMSFGNTDTIRDAFDFLHNQLNKFAAHLDAMGRYRNVLSEYIAERGVKPSTEAAKIFLGRGSQEPGMISNAIDMLSKQKKLSPEAISQTRKDLIKQISKIRQGTVDQTMVDNAAITWAVKADRKIKAQKKKYAVPDPATKLTVGETPDKGGSNRAEKDADRDRIRNLEQEIERITIKYDLQRQFITGYGGKESDAIRLRIQEINEEIEAYRAREGLMTTEAGKDKVRLEILKGQHDLNKESTALEIANYKDAQGKKEEYLRIFSNRETELINFRIKSLDEEIKKYEALAQFSLFMRDFEGAAKSNAAIAALKSSKGEQTSALVPATAREKISDTSRVFGIRQTDLEAQFNLQKEMYQMENASEEELLVIDGKRLDAQEAWNDNLNMQLLVNGLNSEEEEIRYEAARKKIVVDRESLRIQAEVLVKTRELKDSDNEMAILKERMGILGYQDYEIAKKMLDVEGERTDTLLLNKQISLEEWLLRSQSLKMANDSAMASKKQRDVLDPRAELQEANVSQFPGIIQYQMKLAFYDQEIAKAREINDIQTENYWIQKKQNEERQKDIVYLDASRQMSSYIGDEMEGLITGSKSWGDVMDSINSVVLKESLKIFEELVLKALMLKLLGWLGGMFGGGAPAGDAGGGGWESNLGAFSGAGGGILPAGTSSIPIFAHPKEMLLPSNVSNFIVDSASKARGGGDGGNQQLTLVNVIDSNFVPASMAKNPGVILNVINEDMLRSGSTRRTFRRGL